MKIGVLSDIHDNLDNLKKAIDVFKSQGAEEVIFCGDFYSPIPARFLSFNFPGKIHCVFGNGDGDRFAIKGFAVSGADNLILHGEYAEIEIANRKIAATHFPFYAQALAKKDVYDAVFYGHSHVSQIEQVDSTLCANPGEIMGFKGLASCGVYDSETNTIEIITLN
jgi:uncharacterized protein